MKQQSYATLKTDRTFEEDMPTLWKAIEAALEKHRIIDRDPDEVSVIELKKLTKRTLKTDWIYGRSRDKYQEYTVNDLPRTVYLQTRFKYFITAKTVMGGVNVQVDVTEEIEKLNSDGTSLGYSKSDEPDSSRASDLLDQIQRSIRSAAP
ncbi:MAG: hypothetical protein HYX41_01510 [Bdellovibrio sp.]|nr:hypothetical protein [Bdellovibrio sp.]